MTIYPLKIVRALAGGFAAASLILLLSGLPTSRAGELEDRFDSPPAAAKPRMLWMWMGSNLTKEGITRDLEALKTAGYGGRRCLA